MMFFCFSSKDRHRIVESIFYHITNYGLPVWYDRQRIILGDQRDYMNFEDGVGRSKYAVIILSHNAINSICACEEIELIYKKYQNGDMYVFPIFYNLAAIDLPAQFSWMRKLVYKELDTTTDSLSACNHILCKYFLDELNKYRIHSLTEFDIYCDNKPVYDYIKNLINAYVTVSDDNHDAKISLLYSACQYLLSHYSHRETPAFYYQGVERLFNETKLHLPIDLRETIIMERLFLLIFNASIFGYIH